MINNIIDIKSFFFQLLLFLLAVLIGYFLIIFYFFQIDKKKKMHKLLIEFPSPEEIEKGRYYELMKGFFAHLSDLLKKDRLSFEVHKTDERVNIFLTVSNKELLDHLHYSLTSITNISVKKIDEDQDPLNTYKESPVFMKRLVLENDFFCLNRSERDFFKRLVDYLASLQKNDLGGVVCVIKPIKKSKLRFIEREIRKRDELSLVDVNNTHYQLERDNLSQKLNSPIFQAEIYTIANHPLIANGLASIFRSLSGNKNRFLIKKFSESNFWKVKDRFINRENFFNSGFRRWFLGSFLNADELSLMFHPVPLNRGRYKAEETKILEACPEFLEDRENNVLIGKAVLKTGEQKQIYFPIDSLSLHTFLCGKTGQGKSTILILLYLSLMEKDKNSSLILLDPHGEDLIEIALRSKSWDDLIYFNLAETTTNRIFTINPLFCLNASQKEKESRVDQIIEILQEESKDKGQTLGTSTEKLLYMVIESGVEFATAYASFLMKKGFSKEEAEKIAKERQITLPDLPYLLKENLGYRSVMETVFKDCEGEIGLKWTTLLNDYFVTKPILEGVENRIRFLIKGSLTAFFEGNSFDVAEMIKQKKRMLIPVNNQSFTPLTRKIVAKVILSEIWHQSQKITREADRKNVYLFCDEFQNFSMKIFNVLLAEARKYKIKLILGNQFTRQLETDIKDSVLNNVSNLFSFVAGDMREAREIKVVFKDKVKVENIMSLPRYTGYLRTESPDKEETCFLSFKTIDYRGNIKEEKTFDDLMKFNDDCLMRYGENIDELNKKHLAKLKDAYEYFITDVLAMREGRGVEVGKSASAEVVKKDENLEKLKELKRAVVSRPKF